MGRVVRIMAKIVIAALAGVLVGMGMLFAAPQLGIGPVEDPETALLMVITLLITLFTITMFPTNEDMPSLPKNAAPIKLTGDEKKDFIIVFEGLNREILAEVNKYKLPARTAEYMKRMMDYNVPKGKLTRGLTVIAAYKHLTGKKTLTEVEYRRAAVLGWTVEWLQAMFLVMDDIMDESETRRGQICWYKVDDVKMNAINDGLLLEAQIYVVLKNYFGSEPQLYIQLIDLLHETTHQTALGQFLDLTTSEPHKVDFSRFSLDVYSDIVIYKTAFYSFYAPAALGMRLAGVSDPALYEKAKIICMEIGHLFQVQDDYLDCYGDPKVIGKVGTDIRDNKCGWLINTALGVCTPAQKAELEANYAKGVNPTAEAKVKAIFKELDLESKYRKHEEDAYNRIQQQIAAVQGMPTGIFTFLLDKIYKREK